ncbi:MAG: hypothetical protein AUI15_20905 [Actinobacteria bacterium 13_2_20CM_2_66_6]|nr:MAG: hypothetical protein AUI15_20905 [Actinobacteria bacterium 13_2_20CM_2_66_6]
MADVFVERLAGVLFAEDEHAVGDFATHGAHEPVRVGVRPRGTRWDLSDGDRGIGQDGVEGVGGPPGTVADQESEPLGLVAEVHQQVSGLLGCPRAVGVRGLIGGRPVWFGCVQCRATSRRCQARMVAGLTGRLLIGNRGRSRTGAARTARSAQCMRGRGLVRRRVAFSWRRTRICTSLAALPRASRVSYSVVRRNAR